jgi:hypothetical protein
VEQKKKERERVHLTKEFVEATQKKKIKQVTKSKTLGAMNPCDNLQSTNPTPVGLRRMLFLVLQKDGREGFAGIQLRLILYQIWTLP